MTQREEQILDWIREDPLISQQELALRAGIMLALRLAAGLAVRAMGLDGLGPALNIMFILPAPYVLPVFADDEGERAAVSSTLSAMTLLTVVAFVILAAIA